METDKYRIIPITDVIGRAFGISNYVPLKDQERNIYDNTAIIIDKASIWEDYFIENNI